MGEGLKAKVGSFVREHKTVGKVARVGGAAVLVGTMATGAIGCAPGAEKNISPIATSDNIQKTEQQQENFRLNKLAENTYYITTKRSDGTRDFMTESAYFGEELASGLRKVGENYDLVNIASITGADIKNQASFTMGFIVEVGPKQSTSDMSQKIEQKEGNFKIEKIMNNAYHISVTKDPTKFDSNKPLYDGDDLAVGLGQLGKSYNITGVFPIMAGVSEHKLTSNNMGASYTKGVIAKVNPK